MLLRGFLRCEGSSVERSLLAARRFLRRGSGSEKAWSQPVMKDRAWKRSYVRQNSECFSRGPRRACPRDCLQPLQRAGIGMRGGLDQQRKAVAGGHWLLIRYDPMVRAADGKPFLLDSPGPRKRPGEYRKGELRFGALSDRDLAEAERLQGLARLAVRQRWQI